MIRKTHEVNLNKEFKTNSEVKLFNLEIIIFFNEVSNLTNDFLARIYGERHTWTKGKTEEVET